MSMDPSSTPTPVSLPSSTPTTATTHLNTNTDSNTTFPSVTASPSDSPIVSSPTADILLSLAKTDQYISHLVHLLTKVVIPYYLCLTNNTVSIRSSSTRSLSSPSDVGLEEGYNGVLHTIGPELTLIARMVHAWIVWNSGKEMGMERLGLSYGGDDGGDNSGDGSMQKSSLTNRNERLPLPRILSNNHHHHHNIHTASYLRATSFVVLYTIGPYLIHRSGRHTGWDDAITFWKTTKRTIQRLVHQLPSWILRVDVDRNGPEHGEDPEDCHDYDGEDGVRSYSNRRTHYNHESLRGEERRRVYEDSRRRMLQRAAAAATTRTHREERRFEATPPTTTTNGSVVAGDTVDSSSRIATTQTTIRSHNRFVSNTTDTVIRNGRRFVRDTLRCASEAIGAQAPLPHGRVPLVLPLSNQQQEELEEEDEDNHRTRNNTRSNGNEHQTAVYLKRYTAVIEWLIRLNLALFYTNGRYPTLLHRIIGVRFRNHNYHNNATLHTPETTTNGIGGGVIRPSYDTIGKMVLLQTLVTLVRAVSHLAIDAWTARVGDTQDVTQQQRRRRQRQRWWWNDGNTTTTIERERTNNVQDTNDMYERHLETCVPSLKSVRDGNTPNEPTTVVHRPLATITTTTTTSVPNTSITNSIACSICMNHRTHPAALVGCGHVFCWGCVQRWITMVRAECPVCRAIARPQDVLPLYHYDNAS